MEEPPEAPPLPPAPSGVHALDEPEAGARAIRGAGLRGASFFIGAALSVVTAPLIVRHLGIANFGRYASVIALLAVSTGLTEGGLGPVGVREYVLLAGEERRRFLRNLYGLRLVLTLFAGALSLAFALAAGYTAAQVAGLAVAIIASLVGVSQVTFAIPAYGELRLGRQVGAELAGQVSSFALIVVVLLAGGGIVPLLAVPAPATLVTILAAFAFVPGVRPIVPGFQLREWIGILRITLPVGLNTAVHTLYYRSVILILSLTAVSLETGYFATGYRVTEVLVGIPVLLVGTTFPVMARAAHSDLSRLSYASQRLLDTGLVVGLWLAGVVALGAPLAIRIIAGPAGAPAVPVLRILAVTLFLAFLSSTFGTMVLALRRHRELVTASAIALVVTLALASVLVTSDGAVGGAIAAAGGEFALVAALWTMVHRIDRSLVPSWRHAPRCVGPLVVAGVAGLLFHDSLVAPPVVFTVLYAGLALVTKAVPGELRAALLSR